MQSFVSRVAARLCAHMSSGSGVWTPEQEPTQSWHRCIASLSQWTEAQLPPHTGRPSRYMCDPRRDTLLRSITPAYARFSHTDRDDDVSKAMLARSLRGGRIWFIGDSVAYEHFYAAACLVGAELSFTGTNHSLRPTTAAYEANVSQPTRHSVTHNV
eukprot:6659317-Prymnesium_polylepis.1